MGALRQPADGIAQGADALERDLDDVALDPTRHADDLVDPTHAVTVDGLVDDDGDRRRDRRHDEP